MNQYANWTVWLLAAAVAAMLVVLVVFNLHHLTQWPWVHHGPRTPLPRLVFWALLALAGLNLAFLATHSAGTAAGWWRIY